MTIKNIAVFVSGKGSNSKIIITYFKSFKQYRVNSLFSSKQNLDLAEFSKCHNVQFYFIDKEDINFERALLKLKENNIHLIVLAGFLKKIPKTLINLFKNKIINIHPALLPKYGGKGMYGMNVHNAVFKNNETESGITIHYVNKNYDEGQIIFQKSCNIKHCKSPEEIALEVQKLEHKYYPLIIEDLLRSS